MGHMVRPYLHPLYIFCSPRVVCLSGRSNRQEWAICAGPRCSQRTSRHYPVPAAAGVELRGAAAGLRSEEQGSAAGFHRSSQHGARTGLKHTHTHTHVCTQSLPVHLIRPAKKTNSLRKSLFVWLILRDRHSVCFGFPVRFREINLFRLKELGLDLVVDPVEV